MGEASGTINMAKLMTCSNDLTESLKNEKDFINLKHLLLQANALQIQCHKDFIEIQKSIEENEKKNLECKKTTAATESESTIDAEIDILQKELDEEQSRERMLREELREAINEIDKLEIERESVEQQRQTIKKFEENELRAQMRLSLCASVTKTIPYLDDASRISGHVVDREKKVVEKFDFDPSKVISFDACGDIWKMINLS